VNATICAHKDCKRTDARPIEMTRYSKHCEFIETRTYQFCPDHVEQLFSIKQSKWLPPADWFAPGYMPEINSDTPPERAPWDG
jgi:hypothetical protein